MVIGNIYLIAAIGIAGGCLVGMDVGSQSAILNTWQYKCYFNQGPEGPPFNDNINCSGPAPSTQGGITASMPGGSFIGSLASGLFTDVVGRKKTIQFGSMFWIIGCILMSAAQNIPMLVVGRFIGGFAVGVISAQFSVYMSELARPSKRGMLVGTQQWSITWGILIQYYIGYGCSFIQSTASFRTSWGIMMVPAFIIFTALFFVPESPRWLASKDRFEEAHQVLALVHAHSNLDDPFVQAELLEIKETVEIERQARSAGYMALFKRDMIWRTHIGIFTNIWCQLTGVNVIMYYVTFIFGMAGIQGNNVLVAGSIAYGLNVVTTLPILLLMDRIGRRLPLIIGGLTLSVWWFASAALMAVYGKAAPLGGLDGVAAQSWEISGGPSKAVIAFSYLVVVSYAGLVGPVCWVYPTELFPLRVRGQAVSVSMSMLWLFNFAGGYFVPPAFQNIAWKTYLVFGVFCFCLALHAFFAFPETTGKPLEEVELMFTSKIPAWKTKTDTKRIRAWEHGDVDRAKVENVIHHGQISQPDEEEKAEHVELENVHKT